MPSFHSADHQYLYHDDNDIILGDLHKDSVKPHRNPFHKALPWLLNAAKPKSAYVASSRSSSSSTLSSMDDSTISTKASEFESLLTHYPERTIRMTLTPEYAL